MDPKKIALVIIDMQRDFCKGGPLAVWGADALIKTINRVKNAVEVSGSLVFASRCWHPTKSVHFKDFPIHCVQNTRGAAFHPKLNLNGAIIILKGMKPDEQGFSVFDGTSENGNPFEEVLKWNGVELLIVCGVALEYCVVSTIRDARRKNYNFVLLSDAARAFDPYKSLDVLHEIKRMNVEIMTTAEAIKKFFRFFPKKVKK